MIISGSQLNKTYGSLKVLDHVDISCAAGEICGVLGANGAGKTTLFKVLFGLVRPDSGTFQIQSNRKKPLGGIIEKPALYEYLNAYENLGLFSKIQNAPVDKQTLTESLRKVGLPLNRKDPVRNFSMGMKQRLAIAVALINDPECLILDEPFSGLDPIGMESLGKLVLELAEKDSLAILISSHLISELEKVCSTLQVLKKGRTINYGKTQEVIAQNTDSHAIYATNITESKILKARESEIKGNCAKVKIGVDGISILLKELYNEGILITSCTPIVNTEKLFENSIEP